jgi:hypothetical protein
MERPEPAQIGGAGSRLVDAPDAPVATEHVVIGNVLVDAVAKPGRAHLQRQSGSRQNLACRVSAGGTLIRDQPRRARERRYSGHLIHLGFAPRTNHLPPDLNATTISSPVCKSFSLTELLGFLDFRS